MSYLNGRLPKTALTEIQAETFLATKTARAWKRLVAASNKTLHRAIAAAGPAGAYRSWAVQDAMHAASVGHDNDAKQHWGLNPNSSVPLAAAGYSTHGFGTRIDVVGTLIDARFLTLAAKHGFTREFGARDPNHFIHDGKTATGLVAAAVTSRPVPKPSKVKVTVSAGDTLDSIAAAHRTSRAALLRLNPGIVNPDLIRSGQQIRVR